MDVDVDPEALTWHGGQILINMRIIILCAIVELCSKVVGLQRVKMAGRTSTEMKTKRRYERWKKNQ